MSAPSVSESGTDEDFTTLISVDEDLAKQTKSVKKTLTLPYWLNEKALSAGVNFSKVLQNALMKELNIVKA